MMNGDVSVLAQHLSAYFSSNCTPVDNWEEGNARFHRSSIMWPVHECEGLGRYVYAVYIHKHTFNRCPSCYRWTCLFRDYWLSKALCSNTWGHAFACHSNFTELVSGRSQQKCFFLSARRAALANTLLNMKIGVPWHVFHRLRQIYHSICWCVWLSHNTLNQRNMLFICLYNYLCFLFAAILPVFYNMMGIQLKLLLNDNFCITQKSIPQCWPKTRENTLYSLLL